MSISRSTTQTKKYQQSSATKLSASETEELKRLDASINRISNAIQEAPYILTIPSDYPYLNHSRDPSAWCRNLPFEPDEEHLQYMSFILPEHAESCIVARTEVDEERDRIALERKMNDTSVVKATMVPTQQSATKKKITLEAYKKKQAGVGTPKYTDSLKEPSTEARSVANGSKLIAKNDRSTFSQRPEIELGKQRQLDRQRIEVNNSQLVNNEYTPGKGKRSLPTSPDQTITLAVKAPHDLPPKISPPRIDNLYNLPMMLTPTLPENIEDELLRLTFDSNPSSTEKKPRFTPQVTPEKASSSQASLRADGVSKGTSQPPKAAVGARHSESKKQLPGSDKLLAKEYEEDGGSPGTTELVPLPKQDSTFIVKLRFRKSKMVVVQQILKLPPKGSSTGKKKQELPVKQTSDHINEAVPARPKIKVENDATRRAEKRVRPEDEYSTQDANTKRTKIVTHEQEKTPRTPSPSLSARSTVQRSQHQTPRKDQLRAVAMTRTTSSESIDITPSRNPSTPAGLKNVGPTSAPGRHQTTSPWGFVSGRLSDLGKKLKHEARDILGKGAGVSTLERKRAVVLNLECVLSFMLAYICLDYLRHQDKKPVSLQPWLQLSAMWKGLRIQCNEYPHPYAFMWQLGAVISARIEAGIVDQGVPKDPNLSHENLTSSVEHWELLQRCSREANSRLPIEDLIEMYPMTWKFRDRGQRVGFWEGIKPSDFTGPYYLPFGSDTTPVQAVRFGIMFLTEWMKLQGVDYELRVKL